MSRLILWTGIVIGGLILVVCRIQTQGDWLLASYWSGFSLLMQWGIGRLSSWDWRAIGGGR